MSERFREILEEASQQVKEWPEWRKSEALRQSEQDLENIEVQGTAGESKDQDQLRANSAGGGK
jgi:hypothetical protein